MMKEIGYNKMTDSTAKSNTTISDNEYQIWIT